MTLSQGWAEALPSDTIRKTIEVGDGHTLLEPIAYIEAGLPQEVVDHLKETHVSKKTINATAVEVAVAALVKLSKENKRLSLDDEDDANFVIEELFSAMMCAGEHEVSAWSPKETIFRNGQIVEEMEAVYGLDVILALAKDLHLEYDSKMGRGYQYDAIAKSVLKWLATREE